MKRVILLAWPICASKWQRSKLRTTVFKCYSRYIVNYLQYSGFFIDPIQQSLAQTIASFLKDFLHRVGASPRVL